MARGRLTFNDFVREANELAPFEMAARGVGIVPDPSVGKRGGRIRAAISDVLGAAGEELYEVRGKVVTRVGTALGSGRQPETGAEIEVGSGTEIGTVEVARGTEEGEEAAASEAYVRVTLRELLAARIEKILPRGQDVSSLSMLDVITLGLTKDYQIARFLRVHGVDLHKAKDLEYVLRVFNEAVDFYQSEVVETETHGLPRELSNYRNRYDVYRVFAVASGDFSGTSLTKMAIKHACALLRIAAVIDYMERDPNIALIEAAEKQLAEIVDNHFREVRGDRGSTVDFISGRRGDMPFSLARLIRRPKTRSRNIAKLLRKPETRAEEVTDRMGMRIQTFSPQDSIALIYKLFFHPDTAIFPAMNIRIGRRKNLLIDEQAVIEAMRDPDKARKLVTHLSEDVVDEELTGDGVEDGQNEYSMKAFKGVVHIIFDLPLDLDGGVRRTFPIELQINDVKGRAKIDKEAPHHEYIARQRSDVRNRVLGNNLLTEYRRRRGRA